MKRGKEMNIKILDKSNIDVVKVDGITFNGKGFGKGWALHVEGMGYLANEGSDVPMVLDTKKYMTAVRDGWGTDWSFEFVQAD